MPINSIAALANSYNNEYGIDVNDLDDDELLELGLLDEDDIESGVNYKDAPELRESEEAVRGPIKNIYKYIKEIQIDITKIDARSLSLLNANSDKLQSLVYISFVPSGDKDKELFVYLNSELGKTASFTELLNSLNKFMSDNNSNQTDKFIELCKANKWRVKPTREGAVCFVPATKLGYDSTDIIAVLYNISSDTIEIMGSQKHFNLSQMRPSSFADHMVELALSY